MKKLQILLSAIAFIFAVGTALAFSNDAPNTFAYQYVDNVSPTPDQCVKITINCQVPPLVNRCRLTEDGPILRETNTPATACGVEMWRIE